MPIFPDENTGLREVMSLTEERFTSTRKLQIWVAKHCAMPSPRVLPATSEPWAIPGWDTKAQGPISTHVPPPQCEHQPNTSDLNLHFAPQTCLSCSFLCRSKCQHCPRARNLAINTLLLSHPTSNPLVHPAKSTQSLTPGASPADPTLRSSLIHMTAADSCFCLCSLPHLAAHTIPLKYMSKHVRAWPKPSAASPGLRLNSQVLPMRLEAPFPTRMTLILPAAAAPASLLLDKVFVTLLPLSGMLSPRHLVVPLSLLESTVPFPEAFQDRLCLAGRHFSPPDK